MPLLRWSFSCFLGLAAFALLAQPFPAVEVTTLDQQPFDLSSYLAQGQPTVVAVWSTTCPNCLNELDHLKAFVAPWAEQYQARIIAVSLDQYQQMRRVRPTVSSHQWPYEILLDPQRTLSQALNFTLIPQLFVVDRKGGIVQRFNGYYPGRAKDVERVLAKLPRA